MLNERRHNNRTASNLPVTLSIGSQVVIQGQLKDLSPKDAFVRMKSNVFIQLNDPLDFEIKCSPSTADIVKGQARISRIAVGEGIAIYFTKLAEGSISLLKQLTTAGS